MEPNELAAVAGRYRDMIYRVALHWCGHPQEAEDATQDTLLKLCATHRTFADEEHLKSWLIRVTINHCKSRLRAPWHTRRLPLEELPDQTIEEAAMLAACNSSGRESSRVPIDYTLVKNIKKPNGARPGMVIYETYYTMLTTPDHAAAQKLLEK